MMRSRAFMAASTDSSDPCRWLLTLRDSSFTRCAVCSTVSIARVSFSLACRRACSSSISS